MNYLQHFCSKHPLLCLILSVLLSLGISILVFGRDRATANLFHIFSVTSGQHLFSVWVTLFFFAITDRIGQGEWKIESGTTKCIAGLILAFCIYHYASYDMMRDGELHPGNWFATAMTAILDFIKKIQNCMPKWFYADGWLNIWWLIRTVFRLAFGLFFIFFLVPLIMAIPFAILYEMWHKRRDMPSTTYEWFAVLIIYPLFFYASLWITFHFEYYSNWFMRSLYLISSTLVIYFIAGYRHRCPNCGSSQLQLIDEYVKVGREEHVGTTVEKGEIYNRYNPHIADYEKVTEHYARQTHTHSNFICQRCSNQWWETSVSTSRRNVKVKDKVTYD